MTHALYRSRPRLAHRPDPVALWRSSSRSRQLRVADGGQGGRETPAVESVVTHGAQPNQAGPRPAGRAPQSYQAPRCTCGCVSGDHNPIIGAGLFAEQHGRCVYCPDCTGFTETRGAA
jgi:hypothetical protein